ncbi:MAG: hypothetical protein WAK90_25295, partial [Pseudolabrys sp.]
LSDIPKVTINHQCRLGTQEHGQTGQQQAKIKFFALSLSDASSRDSLSKTQLHARMAFQIDVGAFRSCLGHGDACQIFWPGTAFSCVRRHARNDCRGQRKPHCSQSP